ncbi:ABC transporter ATP-binding protein [Conexibacter woesei]|uniref:ABC transporter related protein n=1 Tax=Conexibacter woesei (strain DSM 14684 / CCUG 47730 / CIP 108061 / JCM 11494 / NBRC 100937 / ID131577) TaxID=469383 RepID=D3FAP8_CONWI|nr:ABC transporter ATP-binding protein [Conexibacter woesei]ADB51211.1 ABC transporter related protein [Conexibacter woesei DSM 14684]
MDDLDVRDLQVHFGGVKAIDGVSLTLSQGEILGLIGPNGAGKSTLLNAVTGFQRPTGGMVSLDGRDVTGVAPQRLARRRLIRTFQAARLFPALSVAENVELGAVGVGGSRRSGLRTAREVLAWLGLEQLADRPAGAVPHGAQRRVCVARALAGRPRFLLLDEPAAGLDEDESERLVADARRVRDELGCGLLLVEHDMSVIMRLCDRVHVLDSGATIAVGPPAEIQRDEAVVRAYLGTSGGEVEHARTA